MNVLRDDEMNILKALRFYDQLRSADPGSNSNKPTPQKGDGFHYFVKWDDDKTGGRYFECNLDGKVSGTSGYNMASKFDAYFDRYNVKAHDDDEGIFAQDRIFKMGCAPKKGDSVIAYYNDWIQRSYAFLGKCVDYSIVQKLSQQRVRNSSKSLLQNIPSQNLRGQMH